MSEVPAWAQTAIGALGAGIAIYAGIRADLARLHERATHALRAASRAHERIDALLTGRTTQGRDDDGDRG